MNIADRNIIVWGDSILKGVVLDDTDTRYKVLDTNCVDRFGEITGAHITNHAQFGMTTGKALERIKRSIEKTPPLKTDIVLIEFGGNDCDFRWAEISADPDKEHQPKTPINEFSTKLQEIITLFTSLEIKPTLITLPPLEPLKYFNWLSRDLNKENILRWLEDVNKIYRWQEAYNNTIIQTAIDNELRLIDVRKNFLISNGYTSKFCTDGIHPNREGHITILDSLLYYVETMK